MAAYDGLEWRKIDLHVHTPASLEDRIDKSATPLKVISKAKSQGLDAICVSDHNSAAWIDRVKDAAKGRGLTIFPGVEITVAGGKTNVHVLGIFDPSKSGADIDHVLSKLDIEPAKRGRTDVIARSTVNDTIDVISANGGIPVLAHSDSDSGVTHDMKGVARTEIIQNPRLVAIHITNPETAVFFNGEDPNYRRKLATFMASDAHTLDEIGTKPTYFKMGAMTVDSLRQCFNDPDIRVSLLAPVLATYPKVMSAIFSKGFLGGQTCVFHDGLNSIIGGKGVGKSLIVDFLRFALDQASPSSEVLNDMNGKLDKQLGVGGTVSVRVRSELGAEYNITRTYDQGDNSILVERVEDGEVYKGSLMSLFPVLVYSQNEIIDIARDPRAQLALIDKLIDTEALNAQIETARSGLRVNLQAYLASLEARLDLSECRRETDTIRAEIEGLDKALDDPVFKAKTVWDHRKSATDAVFQEAQNRVTASDDYLLSAKTPLMALTETDKLQTDLASAHAEIQNAIRKLVKDVETALTAFKEALKKAETHRSAFAKAYSLWESEYLDFTKKVGGQKFALARSRTDKQKRLDQLVAKSDRLTSKVGQFDTIAAERQRLLTALDGALAARYKARVDVYRFLTDNSRGKLRLTVASQADRTSFAEAVLQLAYGTRIRAEGLRGLATELTPAQFADAIVNRRIAALSGDKKLSVDAAIKLADAVLSDEDKMRKCLALPFDSVPQDVPRVEFKKEDAKYYPLSELSVGQKCTALLLIALSKGTMPVIVDQPEDALDIATVYEDVVSQLRGGKESRQFILTTHNPNIAVSADSDKYHVLKASQDSGQIVCCGSIDNEAIRDEVVQHLEGGQSPYILRGKKYGIVT